jgi:hypothetical protein
VVGEIVVVIDPVGALREEHSALGEKRRYRSNHYFGNDKAALVGGLVI